jgi:hypothetical protein
MNEQRSCKLLSEYLKNLQEIRFMACHERKVYSFDPEQKAYCIYGRAVSAIRRKGK